MRTISKKGFTLIELLVVIAIIAILMAILFPVFSHARDKARQATCQSHMKQIGTALQMYLQDWDEEFFGCVTWGVNSRSTGYPWPYILRPYLLQESDPRKIRILVCPAAVYPDTTWGGTAGFPQTSYPYPQYQISMYSYTWNAYLSCRLYPPYKVSLPSLVRQPANCPAFVDGNYTEIAYPLNPTRVNFIHNDGANLLYVDGHVAWKARNRFYAEMFRPDTAYAPPGY